MVKNYLDWFNEFFLIDQTSLVKDLFLMNDRIPLEIYNCPEYYITGYDISFKSEADKDAFINKHVEIVQKEKTYLNELVKNEDCIDPEVFYSVEKLQKIKECITEIEIQIEILELIRQNLKNLFDSCKWFPFTNKILFDLFHFTKLPLVIQGNNYWLGVLPERIKYEPQNKFFSVLKAHELPNDYRLLMTKLRTWVDIEYKKASDEESPINFDMAMSDIFVVNARKIARQRILDNWDNRYTAMHVREND